MKQAFHINYGLINIHKCFCNVGENKTAGLSIKSKYVAAANASNVLEARMRFYTFINLLK